jgi:hypothetical protein
VLALTATTGLIEVLGFQLTKLGSFIFLLFDLGRPNWIVTLLVSVAGSFCCFYLFDRWLTVPLPKGSFGF